MNRTTVTASTVALVLVFVGAILAQNSMPRMSGNNDHNSMPAIKSNSDARTFETTNCCQEMTVEFAKLHDHFNQMIKITEMGKLKAEMQKHDGMMVILYQKMLTMKGVNSASLPDSGPIRHDH